jgi:hypothetical protein
LTGVAFQVKDDMGMFVRRLFPGSKEKLAGHPQMGDQQYLPVAGDQDEFAFAAYFPYDSPLKGLAEPPGRISQHLAGKDPDGADFFADQLPAQAADDGFYFGQFRHIVRRSKVKVKSLKD